MCQISRLITGTKNETPPAFVCLFVRLFVCFEWFETIQPRRVSNRMGVCVKFRVLLQEPKTKTLLCSIVCLFDSILGGWRLLSHAGFPTRGGGVPNPASYYGNQKSKSLPRFSFVCLFVLSDLRLFSHAGFPTRGACVSNLASYYGYQKQRASRVCLFVCSFVCLFVRSCVCLFVCLCICLFRAT